MQTAQLFIWILMTGVLGIHSIYDIREKKLPAGLLFLTLIGALGYAAWVFLTGQRTWGEIALGWLPGGIFLFIAFWTGEKIGYGDGLLLLAVGAFVGLERGILCVLLALLLASAASVGLLICRRVHRDSTIPFVPFLTIGVALEGILRLRGIL